VIARSTQTIADRIATRSTTVEKVAKLTLAGGVQSPFSVLI
jgi:hypothetical protein